MKKLFILMLTFVFAMSCLVGCGGTESEESFNNGEEVVQNQEEENESEEPETDTNISKGKTYTKAPIVHNGISVPETKKSTLELTLTNHADNDAIVTYNDTAFHIVTNNDNLYNFEVQQLPPRMTEPFKTAEVEWPDFYEAWREEWGSTGFIAIYGNKNAQTFYEMVQIPTYPEQTDYYYTEPVPATISGMPGYTLNCIEYGSVKEAYALLEIGNYVLCLCLQANNPDNVDEIFGLFLEGYEFLK